ncbi:MAG: COX15/CtaA family protein [Polyangiaceae bacterium]|nr:COX15/CtaA family protein [Polyangiaceae bacterium]
MQGIVTPKQAAARPFIRIWLYAVAGLVFAMVIVGGATRLTDSGLSITEWKPILGAIPPLNDADWHDAFRKYQTIPEYHLVNKGMTLESFKFIYWWEWSHRFLGRFIGLAFFVPFMFFWVTRRIERAAVPRLLGLFVLGGLQGLLGWYMVKSGLVDRVDVSQYRLAAHLTLAMAIYAAIVWTALGFGKQPRNVLGSSAGKWALGIVGLVFLQIAIGGFVAGLKAGLNYNTWPLMADSIVPPGLGMLSPWWTNLFENAMTVQFLHRMVAYALFGVVLANTLRYRTVTAKVLFGTMLGQAILGICTLLWQVPISLALLHQAGALVALAAAIVHTHHVASCTPVRDEPARAIAEELVADAKTA